MHDLQKEFKKLAKNGYLGNSAGEEAYAYMRSSFPVEEGSSFTRQLENINSAALRDGLKIPFHLIYFDNGYTGFDFEHRPALLKLLYEIRNMSRASHIIIEDIDRLSRNADWQQGYLLEEFYRHKIEVHFYINPGSALERYVRGFMAQEEMRKARERMRMGGIYKAMSGKVTAKRPRYGYILTNDSRYELHPEESKIMRQVYEFLIYKGWTLNKVARWLNNNDIPTRFKTGFWTASTLYQLVKSPVYKGDFYANRHYGVPTGEYRKDGRPKIRMELRPKEEWIHVAVPAIVSEEEWNLAMKVMKGNAKKSSRNCKKRNWLLSGIVKCAVCRDFSYSAVMGNTKKTPRRYYKCNSASSERARGLGIACGSKYVYADILEKRVWEEIEKVILEPDTLLKRLDERHEETHIVSYRKQLEFVEKQLGKLDREKERLESAYFREIYSLDEFEERMNNLRARSETLEASHDEISEKITNVANLEEQKRVILAALSEARRRLNMASGSNVDYELKRKILTLLVDVVWVDEPKGIFILSGEIESALARRGEGVDMDDGVGFTFSLI